MKYISVIVIAKIEYFNAMKMCIIIVFSLLSVWSLFGFELDKPSIIFRYGIAFLWVYPLRFLLICAFTLTLGYLVYELIWIKQLQGVKIAYHRAEELLIATDQQGYGGKTVDGTIRYTKIINELSKPLVLGIQNDNALVEFIVKSRRLHNLLPKSFRAPIIANSFQTFAKPTQIVYMDMMASRHTLMFVINALNRPDLEIVRGQSFGLAPDLQTFKNANPIISSAVTDGDLTTILQQINMAGAGNSSFYPVQDHFGVMNDPSGSKRFTVYFIPQPFRLFDFNKILKGMVAIRKD